MNILDLAITMENDLEKFYLNQGKLNKGNPLEIIFNILAKEEKNHADFLMARSKALKFEIDETNEILEAKNIFKNIDDFASEIKELPSQLDSFRMALDFEKQSIETYTKMLNESEDDHSKILFQFLIKQEKDHYDLIDELIRQLSRPEEWIENAEFGVRKEY